MAGSRGLARFRGEQLDNAIMRDRHFDTSNKINENKIDIQWANHREILENTKIDVWVQVNGLTITSGATSVDVTSSILNPAVATGANVEGAVLAVNVELRKSGTPDFPYIDADGDRVYGKLRYDSGSSKFYLDFYSIQGGVESAFTFSEGETADFKYATRTNLSVIPSGAILNGGAGLVADAVDAKAYMNLQQLMKDLYGGSGTLDNDGNANLAVNIVQQVADEVQARSDADDAIRDDLASTAAGKGASLVGVVTDPNYNGLTVQAALIDLAARLKATENLTDGVATRDANTANNYFAAGDFGTAEGRINDLEQTIDSKFDVIDTVEAAQNSRLNKLETEDDRHAIVAAGGETSITLPSSKKAKPMTLFFSLRGALQAPGINYTEISDVDGNVTGIELVPDTLAAGDEVFLWWKNA